jgi:NADH dehydrogenase
VTPREVRLNDGTQLTSFTLIWTAGASRNPTVDLLDCPKERGRLKVNELLSVGARAGIWAVGDCALVPDLATGEFCPPTAQHAVREGKVLAYNILAEIRGTAKKPFKFRTLGQLASIGRRTGVAQILGVKFSGFLAWFLWRGIYWSKLPRMEKKVRVAIDWLLDVLFTKDFTQFIPQRAPVISMPVAAINLSSSAAAPPEHETKHGGVKRIHHETAHLNH